MLASINSHSRDSVVHHVDTREAAKILQQQQKGCLVFIDNDKDHLYLQDTPNGFKQMVSPSTSIKSFVSPFDAKEVVAGMRKRGLSQRYQGMTDEEIIQSWTDRGTRGTKMHQQIENYFNGETVVLDSDIDVEYNLTLMWWDWFQVEYPNWKPFRTEWIVYDQRKNACGTIDFLLQSTVDPSQLIIVDWKLSEIIRREGFRGATCKGLLSQYPECNFTKYSFSLNWYKQIVEQCYGYNIVGLYLVSVHRGVTAEEQEERKLNPMKAIDFTPCIDMSSEMNFLWSSEHPFVHPYGSPL